MSDNDVKNVFGTCFISDFVSGLTVGMVISLKFPLAFKYWSVWLGNTLLTKSALSEADTFITAPTIFDNDNISVKLHTDKYNVVTSVKLLHRTDVASWGTLQYEKIELI